MEIENDVRPPTVSHIFGELTWLITQSAKHQDKRIKDLSWILMMPVLKRQFHIFRAGPKPIGAAIWALTDDDGERAIIANEFDQDHCFENAWCSGPRLWLLELIAPFSTPDNHQAEVMLADLMTGPFSGKEFKAYLYNPTTGRREAATFKEDAGSRLAKGLAEAIEK